MNGISKGVEVRGATSLFVLLPGPEGMRRGGARKGERIPKNWAKIPPENSQMIAWDVLVSWFGNTRKWDRNQWHKLTHSPTFSYFLFFPRLLPSIMNFTPRERFPGLCATSRFVKIPQKLFPHNYENGNSSRSVISFHIISQHVMQSETWSSIWQKITNILEQKQVTPLSTINDDPSSHK